MNCPLEFEFDACHPRLHAEDPFRTCAIAQWILGASPRMTTERNDALSLPVAFSTAVIPAEAGIQPSRDTADVDR
jgi:hypothetical protein